MNDLEEEKEDLQTPEPEIKKRRQVIVDPESAPGLSNHYTTVSKALDDIKPNTVIKITSGNYKEVLNIRIPNITFEPREKGGEVTIISEKEP